MLSQQTVIGDYDFDPRALENWLIDGIVQRLCISVIKTFGTGFDICEFGIIDFGRWWNQARFLWKFVDTDYSGARMTPRTFRGLVN